MSVGSTMCVLVCV
uniref:Uncharacterized protein n=1 Tax=Moniliophthora roreri TaxID=221103 RepID=A0A0W0GBW4_MONRR